MESTKRQVTNTISNNHGQFYNFKVPSHELLSSGTKSPDEGRSGRERVMATTPEDYFATAKQHPSPKYAGTAVKKFDPIAFVVSCIVQPFFSPNKTIFPTAS